jgi:hypothetical protein
MEPVGEVKSARLDAVRSAGTKLGGRMPPLPPLPPLRKLPPMKLPPRKLPELLAKLAKPPAKLGLGPKAAPQTKLPLYEGEEGGDWGRIYVFFFCVCVWRRCGRKPTEVGRGLSSE